ncbi:MAG: hypothetical protein K0S32_1886 [Bacteroidetes bacterium]|jgi:hypothetical protein|nr:hypothetical protein [Bacteroidota bacterium]
MRQFVILFICLSSFGLRAQNKNYFLDINSHGIMFNPVSDMGYVPDTGYIRIHKIKTVSYTEKGTDIKDLKKVYKLHYFKSGKPQSSEYIDGSGEKVTTAKYYLDGKNRIKAYWILKPIPDSLVWSYDANGFLSKEELINMPKTVASYKWKNGKLFSKRYQYLSGKYFAYDWEYNAKGNVTALYETKDDTPRRKMTEYFYNANGKNIKTVSGGATCTYSYNTAGWLTNTQIIYPEGYGDKIEESFYNWNKDGTLTSFKFVRRFTVKDKSNTQLQGALDNNYFEHEYNFKYEYWK